jgi:hypothetical protein
MPQRAGSLSIGSESATRPKETPHADELRQPPKRTTEYGEGVAAAAQHAVLGVYFQVGFFILEDLSAKPNSGA